ncbi:hypothetical protein [Cognatishimia maritima]|uniref:hypothetical protein n=1 Tax=Cognatishimia maritima TaxID=870908 RepID=UPI0009354216|nr:hypothetical protein [Cognatishimia maritima]
MNIGHYISGGAHALLIGYALFGGVFSSEPEPPVVTGVDIITSEQFDALFTSERPPSAANEVEVPVAPEISDAPPAIVIDSDPTPEQNAPEVAETPDTEADPETPAPITPPVDVAETVPEITPPAPPEAAPETSVRPNAAPVTRVAPEAVPTPQPDVRIADVDQAPTAEAETETEVVETREETARQEAAPEIPTEPKTGAVTSSVRPKARPNRPTPTERPSPTQPTAEVPRTASSDSIADALAEAQAETPAAPSGPPMTQGEKDALRISVQECWTVDVGSQAANVIVTVGMSLDRDGRVVGGSLKQLGASGGDENAARAAYEAARRAILRCQEGGYKLPIEKYDHWRNVEITFNPEKMRRR